MTGLSPAKQYFYKVKTTGYTSSESETASFCTKDRYEDNNTLDSATPISWAGEIFNGTIHDSNDEDYYTVSLDKTGIIYLTLEDIPADCDYDLWLADQDGNALAYSSNYGDVDEAIVYIAEPGTYYAVIECYRRYKGDAPYSFTYDFEPLNLNSAEVIDELHYGGDGVYSATGNYSKTFSDLNFTNTAYD